MGIHKKDTIYTIQEETDLIKMSGEATVEDTDKVINNINVDTYLKEDETYLGNTSYAEIPSKQENFITFNYTGNRLYRKEIETLLQKVITEIKQTVV
jgi:hypothetical protein